MRSLVYSLAVLLSLGAGFARADNDTGMELLKQGKTSQAVDEFLKAIELNPKETASRIQLAAIYEREGRLDEAIYHYEKVLNAEPRNVSAHNNLGVLYNRRGAFDEAIGEFEAALEIDPKNALAARNLEIAKKSRSGTQERERQIAAARADAEARPDNPGAVYNLARTYAFYGDKQQAMAWLEKALRLGFKDIASLEVDAALQSLRNDPDYQRLLAGR